MIGLDLLAANRIDTSQNIYNTNPVVPQPNAPAPTSAVSYYPEAPGFVEDTSKVRDINRDFGTSDYVPQWDVVGAAVFVDMDTVRVVQAELKKWTPALEIDGKLGPATRAAVKNLNVARGAPEDGEDITEGTLAELKINPLGAPITKATKTATSAQPSAPAPEDASPDASKRRVYLIIGGIVAVVGAAIFYFATGTKPAHQRRLHA